MFNIYLNNNYASLIVDKHGDQNNDPPSGQIDDDAGTNAKMEHVKINLLEGMQSDANF